MQLRCSGEDASAALVVVEEARVVGLGWVVGLGASSWSHLPWQSGGAKSSMFDAV